MINAIIRCVLKLWNLYAYSYLRISIFMALTVAKLLATDDSNFEEFILIPPGSAIQLVLLFVFYVIPLVVGLIQLFLITKYIITYNFDPFDLFDFLHEKGSQDSKFIRIILKWPVDVLHGYVLLGCVGFCVAVGSINFPAFKEIGEIILTGTGVSLLCGLILNPYILWFYVWAVVAGNLTYLLIKYLLTCLLKLLKITQ